MRSSFVACCVLIAACSKGPGPGVRSVVLMPFEDLRGAAGEPFAEAMRLAIAQSLEAQETVLPVLPAHVREIPGLPVTFRVDGFVAPDAFHLSINSEPVVCKETFEKCVASLAAEVAARTGAAAAPPPAAAAVLAFAKARQLATEDGWRAAAAAHKNYGPIWLAHIEQTASKGPEHALSLIRDVDVSGWRPVDQARLNVLQSVLQRDKTKASEAFEKLAALTPADLNTRQRAGAAAVEARRFGAGVAIYERILAAGQNPAVANEAAYAAAFAGDRAKAENFVARALQGAPGDPRYIDTAGDVAYFYGDYASASRHYAAANAHAKAAEAFALAGDKVNAEAALTKLPDDGLIKALWLWRTKQNAAAVAELEKSKSPRAQFFLALAKLHAKDFSGAKTLRQRVPSGSVESLILSALIDAPPPGANEAVHGIHAFLRGDKEKCLAQIAAAKNKLHPFADSSLRRIEAAVTGKQGAGYIPAQLDDWVAFLASP